MSGGLYVKLDASYEDDEKIIQAGEKAELLYIRSLCLVKRILSDGFVSDAHLPKFGLSSVQQRARTLVEVGLWERDDERGGYWICAWLKHNPSRDHVEDVKQKRKQAGSKGGKQAAKQSAEQSASSPAEQNGQHGAYPEAEAEAEAEAEKASGSHGSPDDEFSEPVLRLTRKLGSLVKANGHKVPDAGTKAAYRWFDAIEKLLRIDEAEVAEVERVMEWCTSDEFWKANILSASKFREQYSRLRLQMPSNGADGKVRDIRGNEVPSWRLPGDEVDEYGTKRAAR